MLGAALAVEAGRFDGVNFVLVLIGGVLLQVGTNMVNDAYDVAFKVDTSDTARPGHAVFEGGMDPERERRAGILVFAVTLLLGVVLAFRVGAVILIPVILGVLGGYFYTAPPLRYKYRGLGVPLVFCLMGPVMVWAAAYGIGGSLPPSVWWASVPVGLLVAAILHANEFRDVVADRRGGARTLSGAAGPKAALGIYGVLLFLPYLVALVGIVAGGLPLPVLVAFATLPLALRSFKQARGTVLKAIDAHTAQVHLGFGVLLALGLVLAGAGL